MANLPARAAEALQQGRFKDAVDLFKQLVRQDPRPEWKQSLVLAYGGRARALAAKGMFKEAAMVLENTLTPAGTLPESRLYATCLIREGQQPKAAAYLLHCVAHDALPAGERAALEELTAALLLTAPVLPAASHPAAARWRELAAAARAALDAWADGATPAAMDQLLDRISLRSAFRPVRLLLKALTTTPPDPERTRQLLATIAPDSPFFALRQAVEAAARAQPGLDADSWRRLTPTQQAFVAETGGLPATAVQLLGRLSAAAGGGPGALFTWLQKQSDLPRADIASACLNLLPQLPDRLGQFEQAFGPLPPPQRLRIQALTAEARGDWAAAERCWTQVARLTDAAGDRASRLSSGVIYRHLARLAAEHREIAGQAGGDARIVYLERSAEADPEHVPTVLERIAYYRQEARDPDTYDKDSSEKTWHRLADEAVQRFPEDSQVLLQATNSAVARRAYKKAAGFARRLLRIDPINPAVRRQMIELQLAHARKQMRARRPDLAAKELAQAAEWDRPDAPSGPLRIARGLVASSLGGEPEQAEAWLNEGVALAGGGVAGWFRSVLEAERMHCGPEAPRLREELARARAAAPTQEAVLAVASALTTPEAGDGAGEGSKRLLAGLLHEMRPWLGRAADIAWPAGEFQILAELFGRFEAFDLLRDFANAARRREPSNPEWRFHEIVARTGGRSYAMTVAETDELDAMAEAAAARQDFHAARRIGRYLDAHPPRFGRGARRGKALDEDIDDAELLEMLQMVLRDMPRDAARNLRGRVGEIGRPQAVAEMVDRFRASEIGAVLPEPALRELCDDMVGQAMGATMGSPGRKGRF
jgi:tetratricopeptide (TPR) repeat protein